MCTAITFHPQNHYFGRNLDLEHSYHEEVTVTPRNFPFCFRNGTVISQHPALIGMATISEGYPLYYDATNEYGLSIAGLNFPGNAVYHPKNSHCNNIAPFELIPWILCQCKNLSEARQLLSGLNLWNTPFSDKYPLSPLHWIIADQTACITAEPLAEGLRLYENPVGVLTNNPPFDYHMYHLTDYLNLRPADPDNPYKQYAQLEPYSRGHGAIGLPGDLSSASRFIKATYTKLNSVQPQGEIPCVSQFFHIITSVAQQEGCVKVGDLYEQTIYTSCCNMDTGTYYYTTYGNRQISGIRMHHTHLDGNQLIRFPLQKEQRIHLEN